MSSDERRAERVWGVGDGSDSAQERCAGTGGGRGAERSPL